MHRSVLDATALTRSRGCAGCAGSARGCARDRAGAGGQDCLGSPEQRVCPPSCCALRQSIGGAEQSARNIMKLAPVHDSLHCSVTLTYGPKGPDHGCHHGQRCVISCCQGSAEKGAVRGGPERHGQSVHEDVAHDAGAALVRTHMSLQIPWPVPYLDHHRCEWPGPSSQLHLHPSCHSLSKCCYRGDAVSGRICNRSLTAKHVGAQDGIASCMAPPATENVP